MLFTRCANGIVDDGLVGGILNNLGVLLVAKMVQHVDTGVDHGYGICDVLSSDGGASVSGAWLEDGVL